MLRLDKFLVSKGYFPSREKAQQSIKQGKVLVDGNQKSSSFLVKGDETIQVNDVCNYVSRGGYKLLGAVKEFNINLKNRIVLDIGASTGGFTQVCLEYGAQKVYALDVGTNQLASLIKNNKNVIDLSKTDFRKLDKLSDVNFIVSDVSFISLKHIVPKIVSDYGNVEMVVLFKPQFECGEIEAKKHNGVVRDKKLHVKLLNEFIDFLSNYKISVSGLTFSSVLGKNGNIEYLFYLNGSQKKSFIVENIVEFAFNYL